MRIRTLYLGIIATLASVSAHSTTPPAPSWLSMTLSDGSFKELRLMGSEDLFWYQDQQGTLYIQGKDQQWYYAEYDASKDGGAIKSTGVLATSNTTPPTQSNSERVKITPVHSSIDDAEPRANTNPNHSSMLEGRRFSRSLNASSSVVEQPLLVVQVSFTDVSIENDFADTIFGQNQQSVQDYFLKNSYGKYKVIPAQETQGTKNDGIIDVSLSVAHPNCHSKTDSRCQTKLNDVFKKAYTALDGDLDLAKYDNDNNGSIEPSELSVMFVFAGNDKSSGTNKTPTIWPHKYAHSTVTIDGKRISAYCLFADYQHDHQSTMGVIAHELGHLMLGLPDLYSYKHDGSIGHWGLMGGGSWGRKAGDLYSGQTPVNMLAWSKEAAGFIEPRVLTQTGVVDLKTTKGESVIYLDPYLKQFGPRLYVENRRKTGYDRALRGEGLLATAVNIDNHFNSDGPMQVQVLEADADGWLESGRSSGDTGDVFPGRENVTLLNDGTSPSLTSITAGRETSIELSNIESVSDSASFTLTIPDSHNQSAWVTSLSRTYPSYQLNTNVLGFSVNVVQESQQLVGFQFYAKPTTVAMPMFYRLLKYPYRVRFGRALVDQDAVEVLGRGVAPENGGQVLLDRPVSLDRGNHFLVLEIENGTAEYSTQFLDAYLGDGVRKPQYFGSLSDYTTHGLQDGFSRNFPFAALFETQVAATEVTVDDYYRTNEDVPLKLTLTENDLGLVEGKRYRVEIGQKPKLGRVVGDVYYPQRDKSGHDEFTYRLVSTGGTVTDYAHVVVDIKSINDAPTYSLVSSANLIAPSDNVTLSLTQLNDVDSPHLSIHWRQVSGAQLNLTGVNTPSLTFIVPSAARVGSRIVLEASVDDNQGQVTRREYAFTIVKSSGVPKQTIITATYGAKLTLSPDLTANIVSLELIDLPQYGQARVEGNTIVYIAPNGSDKHRRDTLSYKVLDENGNEQQGRYQIELNTNTDATQVVVTPSQDEGSGGSNSLLALCLLVWIAVRRK
ncbi:M6 family metalloprotease domain-containing protein [Vibrio sp. JPW-9-11-11]|uniref:M6 family metalloprotease domain-containing protein n=1 Tax=Vibrio sp. JPW-9-11-11 TaxID=1416532 RepID=UPI001592E38E|nr:M6 family metalloprotease domain-containing protein [Vibrio sp. JPW-9-11-11]NVD07816.1 M6 family metalloprotease domain-containing protein [Vibrio sp. JPW-9-11-11]